MGKEKPKEEKPENQNLNPEAQEHIDKFVKEKTKEGGGRIERWIEEKTPFEFGDKAEVKREAETVLKGNLENRLKTSTEKITEREIGALKKEIEAESKKYLDAIESLINRAAGEDRKLSDKELYDLIKLAQGLNKTYEDLSERYQDLFLKASRRELEPEELNQIASLITPSEIAVNARENFKCAAAGAIISVLSPAQKLEVSKMVINKNPRDADKWIEAVMVSGTLTVAQGEELWNYARNKGLARNKFDAEGFAKTQKALEGEIGKRIDFVKRGGDLNPALKYLDLKHIGGAIGIFWAIVTGILNGAVHWKNKDLKGFFKNPYVLGAVAAATAGHTILTGKLPLTETLAEKGADEREKKAIKESEKEITDMFDKNPKLARYLASGGYSKIREALYENFRENKKKEFTYQDLIKREKDPTRMALLITLKEELQSQKNLDALNRVAKITTILNWPFDSNQPRDSQSRFAIFYEKYTREAGLNKNKNEKKV